MGLVDPIKVSNDLNVTKEEFDFGDEMLQNLPLEVENKNEDFDRVRAHIEHSESMKSEEDEESYFSCDAENIVKRDDWLEGSVMSLFNEEDASLNEIADISALCNPCVDGKLIPEEKTERMIVSDKRGSRGISKKGKMLVL
ncbi:hypothetical protein ACFX1T_007432 [Malus domestica]